MKKPPLVCQRRLYALLSRVALECGAGGLRQRKRRTHQGTARNGNGCSGDEIASGGINRRA